MTTALGLISVEHTSRQSAGQYRSQFPTQVGRIAQAGIHALAEKRWLQVCCITREEYAANAETLCNAGMMQINATALDAQQDGAHRIMWPQHTLQGVRVLHGHLVLVTQKHELIAPIAIGQIDRHMRPQRVAIYCRKRFIELI